MTTREVVPALFRFQTRGLALRLLVAQLIFSAGLLAVVHGANSVVPHVACLFVITVLGIGFALFVLDRWKRERQQRGRPIFPWMLLFLVLALAYQTVDGADVYIKKIHGGDMQVATITEGFSFSVQTVTTVGYGNWPFPGMKMDNRKLLELREYSIGLMLVGASLFTIVIGMTTTWLAQM